MFFRPRFVNVCREKSPAGGSSPKVHFDYFSTEIPFVQENNVPFCRVHVNPNAIFEEVYLQTVVTEIPDVTPAKESIVNNNQGADGTDTKRVLNQFNSIFLR